MKNKLLLIGALFFTVLTNAQIRIYAGVSPTSGVKKIRLSGELEIREKFSLGAVYTNYYGAYWKGNRIDFNARYYLTKVPADFGASGVYSIFQAGCGVFKTPYTLTQETYGSTGYFYSVSSPHFIKGENSFGYGIGFGLGYKKSFRCFYFDINFKYQRWLLSKKEVINETLSNGYRKYVPIREDGISFRIFGPGARFAPSVVLGYVF